MLRSFLLGFVTGARSLVPIAVVALADRRRRLAADNGAPPLLGTAPVAGASLLMAGAEMLGDKAPWAPDRIVASGMAVRLLTGAAVGAAMAPRRRRATAALLGVAGAALGAHLTFRARMRGLRRVGQTQSGVIEDLAVLIASMALVDGAGRGRREADARRAGA